MQKNIKWRKKPSNENVNVIEIKRKTIIVCTYMHTYNYCNRTVIKCVMQKFYFFI